MEDHGVKSDELSSLYVPFGTSVDLFYDSGYSGNMLTVTGAMFEDEN